MSLDREQIEKVALLARLRLSETELETMTSQLAQIVEYVEQLGELDTQKVAPLAHAVELVNVFRPDVPHASLSRKEALANAPKRDDECYRVPAVLGQ